MTIFYHGSDHDGHCSGAIAKMFYNEIGIEPELYPIDYGQKIPDVTGKDIVILDFSFQPDEEMMKAVSSASSITWIDHHISAIKKFGDLGLNGIRDTQYAACELAWKFFYPSQSMPTVVELLGKYDSWRHNGDKDILGFEYFMQAMDTDPRTFDWGPYFNMSKEQIYEKANIGSVIGQREKILNAKAVRNAYERNIGGLRCLCLNSTLKGSLVFGDKLHDYDACMIYFRMAGGDYACSIYSTDKNNVDVSAVAVKFGGGGHRKASGFKLSNQQFNELLA